MMNELNTQLEKIAADDTLKCVVVTGAGRNFCAGVEVADHKPDNVDRMVSTLEGIAGFEEKRKPIWKKSKKKSFRLPKARVLQLPALGFYN